MYKRAYFSLKMEVVKRLDGALGEGLTEKQLADLISSR
jgi:hypothetical protein